MLLYVFLANSGPLALSASPSGPELACCPVAADVSWTDDGGGDAPLFGEDALLGEEDALLGGEDSLLDEDVGDDTTCPGSPSGEQQPLFHFTELTPLNMATFENGASHSDEAHAQDAADSDVSSADFIFEELVGINETVRLPEEALTSEAEAGVPSSSDGSPSPASPGSSSSPSSNRLGEDSASVVPSCASSVSRTSSLANVRASLPPRTPDYDRVYSCLASSSSTRSAPECRSGSVTPAAAVLPSPDAIRDAAVFTANQVLLPPRAVALFAKPEEVDGRPECSSAVPVVSAASENEAALPSSADSSGDPVAATMPCDVETPSGTADPAATARTPQPAAKESSLDVPLVDQIAARFSDWARTRSANSTPSHANEPSVAACGPDASARDRTDRDPSGDMLSQMVTRRFFDMLDKRLQERFSGAPDGSSAEELPPCQKPN